MLAVVGGTVNAHMAVFADILAHAVGAAAALAARSGIFTFVAIALVALAARLSKVNVAFHAHFSVVVAAHSAAAIKAAVANHAFFHFCKAIFAFRAVVARVNRTVNADITSVAPVKISFCTFYALAAADTDIFRVKQAAFTVLAMSLFVHCAFNAEFTEIAPFGNAILTDVAAGAKPAVVAHKAFFAACTDFSKFYMAFKAIAAAFDFLITLAATGAAAPTFFTEYRTCINAFVAFRAMYPIISGAVIAISAVLANFGVINALVAV